METTDPPDIHALFNHYNELYFREALGACIVSWSSEPPLDRCTGTCDFPEGYCQIYLSEPLLKFCSADDLKNILLHEMIHAFLWVQNGNKDHSDHGARFLALVDAINSGPLLDFDHQKPSSGYNISIYHDFSKKVDIKMASQWTCESCGDSIQRSSVGEPSVNDCIESVIHDESCSNQLCPWHRHRELCSGSYIRKADPSRYRDEGTTSKGELENQKDKYMGIHYTRGIRRLSWKEGMNEYSKGKNSAITINNVPSDGDVEASQAVAPDKPKKKRAPPVSKKKKNKKKKKSIYTGKKRTPAKKSIFHGKERRKGGRSETEYNVIIESLGVFANEEDEYDEPLINRRTERRKRQRLWEDLRVGAQKDDGQVHQSKTI